MTGVASKMTGNPRGLGRRELIWAAATSLLGAACGGARTVAVPPPSPERRGSTRGDIRSLARGPLEVWSVFDLPDDPRSREISGIAWDEPTRTLYGVQDETRDIVVMRPDETLTSWRFEASIPVAVSGVLDLEAIVVFENGFLVASEAGPRILELDREGRLRSELRIPARFLDARPNQSLESLTLSPSRRFLFTVNEGALPQDGPIAKGGTSTRVRILKMDRMGAEISEHAYETDRSKEHGDLGIAELVATSDDELLVLERGWAKGVGNSARLYRVSLDDPRSSSIADARLAPDKPVLEKTLVVDVASLTSHCSPAKQPQANPLLDNYEAATIGPRLADGRPTLLLATDDNARSDQIPRVLVLTTPA